MGPITGSFGERIDPFNGEGAFHSGVDISCHYGQPVLAPSDGVVTFAGPYNGYGRMIQVDHGNGVTTRYGHLSGFSVAEGQTVRRGQVIGYVGLSGRSTGPHLHYEVRIHDTPVNPHKFLRSTTVNPGEISRRLAALLSRLLGRRSLLLGRLLCVWPQFHGRLAEHFLKEGVWYLRSQHRLVFLLMDFQAVKGSLHIRIGPPAIHRNIE